MTRRDYRRAYTRLNRWERRAWEDGCIRITSPDGDWELTEYGRSNLVALAAMLVLGWILFLSLATL